MSQVRNLRAMFEQKGDTSPPDRGRSPGIPTSGTESPRPLSRIRTNFIAVEKDGRIGLQRDPSRDSSVSTTRQASGETDTATPPALLEKSNAFDRTDKVTKTNLKEQPIPESPRADTASHHTSQIQKKIDQPKAKGENSNVGGKTEGVKTSPEAAPAAKGKATTNGTAPTASHGASNGNVNGSSTIKDRSKGKEAAKASAKVSAKASTKPSTATATGKTTPKVAPILTTKTTAKPTKSPTVTKVPKSPAVSAPKYPAKTPEKHALHPEKASTPKTSASASKSATSSLKKPPPLQHPSGIGFVKPKPKSPTRPVRLPAGLTTHTTASVSKLSGPRQSVSRASGTLQPFDPLGRSPSRVSVSTVATTATNTGGPGTKTLKRQSSTISRPRPSLGPPPKPKAKDHPPTRKEREIDEGFLARMMRPTQASSSKVAEKAPTTPPRKAAGTRTTPKSETKRVRPIPTRTGSVTPSSQRHGNARERATSSTSHTPVTHDATGAAIQLPLKTDSSVVESTPGVIVDSTPKELESSEDTTTEHEGPSTVKDVQVEIELPEDAVAQDAAEEKLLAVSGTAEDTELGLQELETGLNVPPAINGENVGSPEMSTAKQGGQFVSVDVKEAHEQRSDEIESY